MCSFFFCVSARVCAFLCVPMLRCGHKQKADGNDDGKAKEDRGVLALTTSRVLPETRTTFPLKGCSRV